MKPVKETVFELEFNRGPVQYQQKQNLGSVIRSLLNSQPFCVLCTQGDGQPYGSLIAFAFSDDLKKIYFSTPRATRKHKLLQSCERMSLVIDNRCEHGDDMKQISAVTVTGRAGQVTSGQSYQSGLQLLRERHPYLNDFLEAESTALYEITVVRFFHVSRFQEVAQWIP